MDHLDAIRAARLLLGSFANAGRSGRSKNFNRAFVTDGVGRTWYGDTFEDALAVAESEAHPTLPHKIARRHFAARGNHTVITIAEHELVRIITEAVHECSK